MLTFLKIRFFWEEGAFDANGDFIYDRFKSINKVNACYLRQQKQKSFDGVALKYEVIIRYT